jgi:DNA-directed RNA polymerase subunit M/transcription elongation factor TFIIS
MVLKFCPTCKYHLYLKPGQNTAVSNLSYLCVNCGYTEMETTGGLISETMVQHKSTEAFKIVVNEFTTQDNTLPHIKTIPCPKETCPTNTSEKERDIIYITYDASGKKNVYICTVCGEQWKSRN